MATHLKAIALCVLSIVLLFTGVLFTRVIIAKHQTFPWDSSSHSKDVSKEFDRFNVSVQRLAKALTFQTVSSEDGFDSDEFVRLHQYIKKSFPLIHSSDQVEVNIINKYSLLYKVKGKRNDTIPYMLAGHLDVVPVSNETWRLAHPFEGKIVDGVIVGRGALDDKSSVMGILEALEFLLENNFNFERTFFIAFGHDEEISGFEGAGHIAGHLTQAYGVHHLDFVLDEGYFVLENFIHGVDRLVSVIGVTEKGYATFELSAELEPGHSSIPKKDSAIGVISKAVVTLTENRHPALFGHGPEADFFSYLAAATPWYQSVIFSNLWLFGPLLSLIIAQDPATDSIQRTTTAVTMINAGYKSNVIPGTAAAVVNHRIYPLESLEQVIRRDSEIINDSRVKLKVLEYQAPTPVSPYGPQVPQFALIAKTVKEIYPTSVIAPACSPANTDLRRYTELTSNLYRILPSIITPETRAGIHGDDEQIDAENYINLIKFYVALMVKANEPSLYSSVSNEKKHKDL